ncbi:MAG: general secretion pathway protein GspK [Deltaproteobacteria bacterium]|jgi:general secretion pathway protein K|nr:general secretion pathway protein GspK [Deltaproteobacteria bacterium]
MAIKFLKNSRGIALLVTLSIVTVLIAASLEMNKKMRSALFSAATTRDRMTLLHMASSGVNLAAVMLVKDKKNSSSDSLQEDWADSEKINEILNDIPFEDGNIVLTINDELGKIQLNSLVQFPEGHRFNESQRAMWERFLNLLINKNEALEDMEPMTIINSIKDWLDSGDDDAITGLNGAESDYYQDLDPSYTCKNGPFTHIGELVLVRGVTPEIFQGAGGSQGLSDYITVFGMTESQNNSFTYEGRVNINTADLPTLVAMLPSGSEDLAQAIYEYRMETSESLYIHDLSSPAWYKNVPGVGDAIIDPNLITTSSDFFRIESTAKLKTMKVKITAVVKRENNAKTGQWECNVLRWEIE